jgi:hypothetical protein
MKIEVEIKDSIIERLNSSDVSKIVNQLLDGYLSYGPLNSTDMLLWRKHIELKLAQIQTDLDQHRTVCKCESTSIILDSNVTNRLTGKMTPLDANSFQQLQQSEIKPKKNKKEITDIQVPLIDNITEIPI